MTAVQATRTETMHHYMVGVHDKVHYLTPDGEPRATYHVAVVVYHCDGGSIVVYPCSSLGRIRYVELMDYHPEEISPEGAMRDTVALYRPGGAACGLNLKRYDALRRTA